MKDRGVSTMSLYLGNNKVLVNQDGATCVINLADTLDTIFKGFLLKSSDGFVLKGSDNSYLTVKETANL
jgi:hypothetical protein